MSTTDLFRRVIRVLFALVVIAAVVGWFLDKDPGDLAVVIGWLVMAAGIGEASNIGKRATWRRDAHEALAGTAGR